MLAHDLHADSPLSGDDLLVIERVHEHHAAYIGKFIRVDPGVIKGTPMQDDFRTQTLHRFHLDARGGLGHNDKRFDTQLLCSQRHSLGMIPSR